MEKLNKEFVKFLCEIRYIPKELKQIEDEEIDLGNVIETKEKFLDTPSHTQSYSTEGWDEEVDDLEDKYEGKSYNELIRARVLNNPQVCCGVRKPKLKNKLKEECMWLIERVNKLNAFKGTHEFYTLPREEKDLLYEQSRLMDRYIQILGKRMELLNIKDFIKED